MESNIELTKGSLFIFWNFILAKRKEFKLKFFMQYELEIAIWSHACYHMTIVLRIVCMLIVNFQNLRLAMYTSLNKITS